MWAHPPIAEKKTASFILETTIASHFSAFQTSAMFLLIPQKNIINDNFRKKCKICQKFSQNSQICGTMNISKPKKQSLFRVSVMIVKA